MTLDARMQNTVNNGPSENEGLLPDFCDNQILFLLILIAEGLAIVLTLSQRTLVGDLWIYLGNTSLFIQSIALIDAAVLCLIKRKLVGISKITFFLILYGLLQLVTILITFLAYLLMEEIGFNIQNSFNLPGQLIQNFCISAIITGAMLRYFYLRHQHRLRQKSEGEARIQALQARIRPHFLFNSLNTIANLTHKKPNSAEEALLDLAELFRSTMGKESHISLEDELEIVRRYLRIEKLRLGDRLNVDWIIPSELNAIIVPTLILQPLIENAIYHGIEPLAEGGHVKISAHMSDDCVIIEIVNPLAADYSRHRSQGNQLAVENIQQRLALAYGNKGFLKQVHTDSQYTVRVTIPSNSGKTAKPHSLQSEPG